MLEVNVMTPTPKTVEAVGLNKRYGQTHALRGLSLTLESGQIVGLLGPNGAGKTTFLRTVATLVKPDSGRLLVDGIDAVENPDLVRRKVGLTGQAVSLEDAMTGRENLGMVARMLGYDGRAAKVRAEAILELVGLEGAADRLVKSYSGGMRRRLDLGASFVARPKVLLLDEPTVGLDPSSRLELWDMIRDVAKHGTDVLLSTQYLEEADQLADRIIVLSGGNKIAEGTPGELKARFGRAAVEVRVGTQDALLSAARELRSVGAGEPAADPKTLTVTLPVDAGTNRLIDAARVLQNAGIQVTEITSRRPTLEDVFLAITRPAEYTARSPITELAS